MSIMAIRWVLIGVQALTLVMQIRASARREPWLRWMAANFAICGLVFVLE